MHKQNLSKREFIKSTAVGLAAACLSAPTAIFAKPAPAVRGRIPIALQLYSVRTECEKDLVGTIRAVAKMGYQGVEFAGYYGRDAKTLRTLLSDYGLKCCGTHIGLNTLQGKELAKTIEFNQMLANKFLIVPGLDAERTKSQQAWQTTAKLFNGLATLLKEEGMRVGYHNHTTEFTPLEGEMPWDTFFGNTKKDVIMQFDTGNAMQGGGDATVFLKRYPGRAASVHLKAFSKAKPSALIGEDELPWQTIFELCETTGKTQWYIVEYESDAYPPLVSVEKCLQKMREWGKIS